jgi:hypothetical protein
MKKAQSKPKRGMGTASRFIRFPPDLDAWLEKRAAEKGYATVGELLRQIVREAKERAEREEGHS